MNKITAALLFVNVAAEHSEIEEYLQEINFSPFQDFTDVITADDDPCNTLKGKWKGTMSLVPPST